MNIINHKQYMSLALDLARRGRLTVSPNPMVGCIIVKDHHIIGRGWHSKPGESHAEVYALKEAGDRARGAAAFVTLEPCCHHGKTPPCTDALIKAGIKEVYVACIDPNPLVAGKGISALQKHGIRVETGWCEEEAKKLNEIFFHFMQHQRPFVIAKWAMSLDGKTVVHAADNRQITGVEAQHHTHDIRQQVDAILVGANTVMKDDPQLTARLISSNTLCEKQPVRIVLAGRKVLSKNLKIFNDMLPGKTIIAASASTSHYVERLASTKVAILILPETHDHQICLHSLLDKLGETGITSVLVEGGMTVLEHFFKENLINKIHVYVAPIIIGSHEMKSNIVIYQHARLGDDIHFTANMEGASNV